VLLRVYRTLEELTPEKCNIPQRNSFFAPRSRKYRYTEHQPVCWTVAAREVDIFAKGSRKIYLGVLSYL
jgi:hypothetical protein